MAGLTHGSSNRYAIAIANGKCPSCFRRKAVGYYCRRCRPLRKMIIRRQYARRKRLGLCVICSGRSNPNRVHCKRCVKRARNYHANMRSKWRRLGLCARCGRRRGSSYSRCAPCRKASIKSNRNHRLRVRQMVLVRYGHSCACCGERRRAFLTLDHVKNDGSLERRRILNTYTLYLRVLRFAGRSSRYQLLCWNCNEAKRIEGRCPHQTAVAQARPA